MAADPTIYERKLARAQRKIAALEGMVEDKTRELFDANRTLTRANTFMSDILRSMAGALVVTDRDKNIELVNTRLVRLVGGDDRALIGRPVADVFPTPGASARCRTARCWRTRLAVGPPTVPRSRWR